MRVFAYHDDGICGYYRVKLPLAELARHGHDVRLNYGWSDDCREYNVIVGQRIGSTGAIPRWRRMRPTHKLVYELDDDVWSIDPMNVRAYFGYTDVTVDQLEQCMAAAHLITVSTQPLADLVGRFNDNVAVLPNYIDPAILDIERPHYKKVTIGWAGGDSHIRDLAMVTVMLREFIYRHPKVSFHNIGTNFLPALKIPGRYTMWKEDIFAYYRAVDFDIGIAPLADTAFNASKSHIKALEYGALGIPTVATYSEPYREFVIDGVTGFLIKRPEDWPRRLHELVNDADMRHEMGAKAKEHARQWTIDHGWQLWEKAYASLR